MSTYVPVSRWFRAVTCGQRGGHRLAQVLAEKEAWKLAEQHHLDLVAICPNFIQGPALSPTLSGTSVGHLKVPAPEPKLGTVSCPDMLC